jgi:para-aminobenzoate synthetase / 4-amino-4-deoxychorismate lyase
VTLALFATLPRPFVVLEDRLDRSARLYRDPAEIVCCNSPGDVGEAFGRLEAGLGRGLHAAGFLSYELGYALEDKLEPLMPARRLAPLFWFGLFEAPQNLSADVLDEEFAALGPPPPITDLVAFHGRAEHVKKVGAILEFIRSGDIYQANLTFPMLFRYAGDPLTLYGALRTRQPVAHGGVVALPEQTILSVSPELFVKISGGRAFVRPMKGTAARFPDPASDAAARATLTADPKQRAENLMIVDLLRNDLSRISVVGSVRTPALFTVETYPTFHTMTSTVTAALRSGLTLREEFAALFPCGSIVGAPKIRAMEILRELEERPRGVYTGAIGSVSPAGDSIAGDLDFNVAIRTAIVGANGEGYYGVGGGVVADSDPDGEYDEALLKARVLSELAKDYGLIETLRWSATEGYWRLDRHLGRLTESANALKFALDRGAAEAKLAAAAAAEGWRDRGDRRVRLELSRDGTLALTSEPLTQRAAQDLKLCIADERLDAADPFLRYKTTRREAFDRAFAQAARANLDEAILLNRLDKVADASRNSIFAEIGGRLVTPRIEDGALPGVLRAALIDEGRAVEGELTLSSLERAERWFVGNSLYGLRPARLA